MTVVEVGYEVGYEVVCAFSCTGERMFRAKAAITKVVKNVFMSVLG